MKIVEHFSFFIFGTVWEILKSLGKSVIVLEDDLITSTYFLKYMNTGLSLYENETNVASIHSYFYPVNRIDQLPNYFFLKGADCWGWGTWRDRWDLFENNPDKLWSWCGISLNQMERGKTKWIEDRRLQIIKTLQIQ